MNKYDLETMKIIVEIYCMLRQKDKKMAEVFKEVDGVYFSEEETRIVDLMAQPYAFDFRSASGDKFLDNLWEILENEFLSTEAKAKAVIQLAEKTEDKCLNK